MKMKKFLLSSLVLLMGSMLSVSLTSCGGDDDPDNVAVGSPMVSLSQTGGSQSIAITSNTNWTVSGAPSWLMVSPMTGSGNGTITVSASENTESARQASLTVQAGSAMTTIQVTQLGKPVPSSLADQVIGTYVGRLTYGDEVLEDAYPIIVTKLSDTAVNVTAAFFDTPQNFNLSQGVNQIEFSNSTLANIKMYVTGNTMIVNYLSAGGYMLSYTGVK